MKFKLAPVRVGEETYQVSHQFSKEEIVRILMMPRIGKKLTFNEAYALRWSELAFRGKLFRYTTQATPLEQFCRDRGYYIEFGEEELYAIGECTEIQH